MKLSHQTWTSCRDCLKPGLPLLARGLCRRHYQKRWRILHPGRAALYSRRYVVKRGRIFRPGRAISREAWRSWARRNPEKNYARVARYRARKHGATVSTLTAAEWEWLKSEYGNLCVWCELPVAELTQDHIRPLSQGGWHHWLNVVPACRSCNSSKKDLKIPDWPFSDL